MKVLLSWLRDFVDVSARPEEIAATMSVRGFAVEGLERLPDGDAVIDFEVTANRPDCLSVVGFAREIGTAYGLPVRLPAVDADGPARLDSTATGESERVKVTIEEPSLCPRYSAAIAELATTTTPDWMRARLHASGVRPINAVVDVTNYVLMELGHPMHAFDLDALEGREIRIRRARRHSRKAASASSGSKREMPRPYWRMVIQLQ